MIKMMPNNQITLLENGEAYFPALETALDQAEKDIFLESYIFENDKTGQRISEALQRAASRGVKTHVLIDGFGSNHLPSMMIDRLRAAGVMVRKFRPQVSPWTFRRIRLRRLHRKIVVVDQKTAFVGGINIIDDVDIPFQSPTRFDYAVRVQGPLVKEIHRSTRRVWLRVALTQLRPGLFREKVTPTYTPESNSGMLSAFVIRNNIRHRRDIENAYLEAIKQARFEIILANAYFLPGLNFRHALIDAAKRGVRVVLLFQGRVEYRLLHYASKALYGSFIDAGIEIYQYHRSLMHAKVAVIDEYWATVGSSNLDPYSLLLALEANIIVEDSHFAKTLKHSLEQAIRVGAKRVHHHRWKTQPIILRMIIWLSYSVVRLMVGMAGYAREKRSGKPQQIRTIKWT